MRKKVLRIMLVIALVGSLVTPIMAEEISFQVASPNVVINKQEITLATSPEIINGKTYIPLELVKEAFAVEVEWNQESKKISMTKDNDKTELKSQHYVISESGNTLVSLGYIAERFNKEVQFNSESKRIRLLPLVPPIAQFKIQSDSFIAGRSFLAINESYSPEGERIVESLWQVSGGNKSVETSNLNKLLPTLDPGTYTIKLKVKNSKQAWSQWVEESIVIKPHPKPIIASFVALESQVDQGETLDFKYESLLEPGVTIEDSRWTYQKEGDSIITVGKPRALFKEGKYTISLEIKDNYGVWSVPATTQIKVTYHQKLTEMQFKMNNIRPGEVFDNYDEYNFQNYEPVEEFIRDRGGPTLLFSNSPETVLKKGTLYADKVEGDTRVLYHHRNGMANSWQNTRLVIIAENNGREPVTITQTKGSTAGPSADILHLGQIVTRRYYHSALDKKIVLRPNEKAYLYNTGAAEWGNYESVSGVLEFHSDKIITVKVAAVDRNFQLNHSGDLQALARDGIHTRGTFPDANKYYNVSVPGDRPSKILLGQREDHMDYWIDGYDALTGLAEQNKGNYGVVYALDLTADEKTGVLLNPRGTSFKGAFRWQDAAGVLAPGQGILQGSRESAVAGILESRATRRLYYSLSNGSSGPVLINFIPELYWDDHQIEKVGEKE